MNYYKKLAVIKVLGITVGSMFCLSELGDDCIFRITEQGLEARIGTSWYPSNRMDEILLGTLGDIMLIGGNS